MTISLTKIAPPLQYGDRFTIIGSPAAYQMHVGHGVILIDDQGARAFQVIAHHPNFTVEAIFIDSVSNGEIFERDVLDCMEYAISIEAFGWRK
jgi:hypothetical protein